MKKAKYDFPKFTLSKLHEKNIDRLAVERVRDNSYVLDIGCATGYIGEYLIKKKKCKVVGVDSAKAEVSTAKKRLSKVILNNVEEKSIHKELKSQTKKEKFDVIIMMSVIEHLQNPDTVLRSLIPYLKKDGIFIVTTPNIAHWTMRLSLLKGNFDYTEYGILDNTHLRFFTPKTFKQLFTKSGLVVQDYAIDSVGGGYPKISNLLSYVFTSAFTYQMVIIAGKNED